ncbi:uncharacterized protein ZMO1_ZMO1633 [Zymomonas mobilis subsp. mobilis ZM4 = ATCC 31821]|uniref:DUF2628 domain-containing protein n=3 Tax=Zymomonas mobilis TaxID=542 RepID=Q5NM03_ZYMMO|nr:hypothetical protein [Zymomonas mobilis]AAV90257.1 hypothetical protein ZMO1633 [Zymomonas mobilis subsp. mobilis ZM4 = ATCC 31821]ACV76120.1 hypothetical protein Za10_1583 [Zymomonas mobilis subsp. mobilis NCIMB 11163]AFN57346.1 hypothetical protein ZZ6_1481 [Zymomonas mobilis subsp. mobilis ATCC 29191]AHB10807.1 hypothetical protein ZCP4_1527 [Zymomonas mobilis subsp. mobilis str. CP4 = NRRL B-14023]AHJ71118.1 hypothetical protein A254_01527 [Zymomonas mobilis subsp. mobilis NRRL B-12526]
MAFDRLILTNPYNGKIRKAPIGFSWTTFFFGLWPAIFRGSWKYALLMFLTIFPTLGLSTLIWPFIFNRLYLNSLLEDGFRLKIAERGSSVERISAYSRMNIALIADSE